MKTLSSLKINKYTCRDTLKKHNHITFILCPQSTITQWIEEIKLIETGCGNTQDDYDILVINKTSEIIDFYNKHSKIIKGILKFDKKSIKKPTYILSGKEVFKLSQVQRPAFNIKIDNEGEIILTCPNCGEQLFNVKKVRGIERYSPMTLADFYKSDKNGKLKMNKSGNYEKNIKKNNFICIKCSKNIEAYNNYVKEKRENKDGISLEEFDKKIYVSSDSKLWTYDFFSNDSIKHKIFNKLNSNKIEKEYTTSESLEKMKLKMNIDIEQKKELFKNFGLRNIYDNSKNKSKKISVVEYLKKRKFKFDSVIIDEAHEGNNTDSIIGTAQRLLFKFSDKVILLSGTCNSGYASSLHNLLVSAMPNKLLLDGTFEREKFISKYGILEKKIKIEEDYKLSGKVLQDKSGFKEVEGINPVVFTKFLSRNFIMVNSLEQLSLPMPELKEFYIPILLDTELELLYNKIISDAEQINPMQTRMLLASTFKNYVNNPYSWENIEIQKMFEPGKEMVEMKTLKREKKEYLRKDYELLKIIKKEKEENRKCFLFTDFVEGGRYIIPEEFGNTKIKKKITINDRIIKLLESNGIRCKVILASNATAKERKDYIISMKDKYDVFICQPQLVNVGLNLVFCPTYIVYTPYYRYDIISQATRRGYRANSTEENRIYHLYYANTCEEIIINRYQRKLAEAKAIEGDFDVNIEKDKNIRTLSKMSNEILK